MNKALVTCKKHWTALIPTGIVALLLLVAMPHVKEWYILALAAVIMCAVDLLIVRATCLELTATSVTGKMGVIKSVKLTAPLSKVQDVAIGNGLLGKVLGYHTVTISTAGTDRKEFVFKNVTNGAEFQRRFLELTGSGSR